MDTNLSRARRDDAADAVRDELFMTGKRPHGRFGVGLTALLRPAADVALHREMNIWAGCGVLLSWPLRVVTAWRIPG